MDVVKMKWKKNVLVRVWKRCWSHGTGIKNDALKKSESWHCKTTSSSLDQEDRIRKGKNKGQDRQVAPEGYFYVYVGPQRQRFVIKTEFANHPLFKMLLEEAELEYGFSNEGPLQLPCDVDLFYKVLAEMDSGEEISTPVCSPLILCSPSRRQSSSINKGYGSYKLLSTPSRMLKLNSY